MQTRQQEFDDDLAPIVLDMGREELDQAEADRQAAVRRAAEEKAASAEAARLERETQEAELRRNVRRWKFVFAGIAALIVLYAIA